MLIAVGVLAALAVYIAWGGGFLRPMGWPAALAIVGVIAVVGSCQGLGLRKNRLNYEALHGAPP